MKILAETFGYQIGSYLFTYLETKQTSSRGHATLNMENRKKSGVYFQFPHLVRHAGNGEFSSLITTYLHEHN
jgi:hypothetical protein